MAEWHSEQASGGGGGYSAFSARPGEKSNEPIACLRCRRQKVRIARPILSSVFNGWELRLQCRLIGPLILNLVLDSSCVARKRNRPARDAKAFRPPVLIHLLQTENFWQLEEHEIPSLISTENLRPPISRGRSKYPILLDDIQLSKKQSRYRLEWP
ncbi:hypothetical protein OIDMADRAFT_35286 [Oidiodendron maius Zn]|uniref:Uncharacterized protein n=1 Tax=Oidiodendron maius (strain Zn) TaxID=913774 RepID=A0A0C3CVT0_OIDMZ|nr:hypothetical protein OIDMADRAFT_35286 [Oidiodendron maius Zn]